MKILLSLLLQKSKIAMFALAFICLSLAFFPQKANAQLEGPTTTQKARSGSGIEVTEISKYRSLIKKTTKEERKFLTKDKFMNQVELKRPPGWTVTRTPSQMILHRDNVIVVKEPLKNLPLNLSESEKEKIAREQIEPSKYEVRIKFKSYSKSQYLESKKINDNLYKRINDLKTKYALDQIPRKPETGYMALTKGEKNRLATYWVEKEDLESQLKEMPEYFVNDHGVDVIWDKYLEIFPKTADIQRETLIYNVKRILMQE